MKVELIREAAPPPVTEVVLRMHPSEARILYSLLQREMASTHFTRNWTWGARKFFEAVRDGMKDAS